MNCSWSFYVVVVLLTAFSITRNVNGKIPAPAVDSFDESFDEESSSSPEIRKALAPTEDALLGFINKLVNTGYTSSKIALNRIEKANQKRRQLEEQFEQFLDKLATYDPQGEVPLKEQKFSILGNSETVSTMK